MADPIDFYMDFISPFAYLASHRIEEVGRRYGRDVVWRPVLLGPLIQANRAPGVPDQPNKLAYAQRDVPRSARLYGVRIVYPRPQPPDTVTAARAYYWLYDRDPALAKAFAQAVWQGHYGANGPTGTPEQVLVAGEAVGVARADLEAALADPAVKDRLRREVDAAIARGVFGTPFVFVDDEPFWGADRIDQVDRWLERGGW
jgi:2-hydroxychromene-2-carboxylate isomerase